MISGMYLGELVRLVLVKFTKMGLLFGGRGSDLLFRKGSFYTKYVSEIESDKPGDYTSCMDVLDELGKFILYLYLNILYILYKNIIAISIKFPSVTPSLLVVHKI